MPFGSYQMRYYEGLVPPSCRYWDRSLKGDIFPSTLKSCLSSLDLDTQKANVYFNLNILTHLKLKIPKSALIICPLHTHPFILSSLLVLSLCNSSQFICWGQKPGGHL